MMAALRGGKRSAGVHQRVYRKDMVAVERRSSDKSADRAFQSQSAARG